MSVGTVMEVLSGDGADGRVHFAFPIALELRRQPFRVYGSAGYFTRGAVFSGGAIEWVGPRQWIVSGILTQSRSIKSDATLDSLAVSRQRADVMASLAHAIGGSATGYISVGRSLSSLAEGRHQPRPQRRHLAALQRGARHTVDLDTSRGPAAGPGSLVAAAPLQSIVEDAATPFERFLAAHPDYRLHGGAGRAARHGVRAPRRRVSTPTSITPGEPVCRLAAARTRAAGCRRASSATRTRRAPRRRPRPRAVEGARRDVLRWFNATRDYVAVFTQNASAALKLVGESLSVRARAGGCC